MAFLALAVCAIGFSLGVAESQSGQDAPRPLASQRRQVALFDFEGAESFRQDLPAPFYRLLSSKTGRPGLPDFGSVQVDDDVAAEGRWSLRFDVGGAAIVVAVPRAELPVFPQSRYVVTARVRTEGLHHTGARLLARLHDIEGNPIDGTERASAFVRSDGAWQTLSVEPPVDVWNAADIVFELQVEHERDKNGLVHGSDVEGHAWFDQIEVWQLPRVSLSANPSSGVATSPSCPTLHVDVRDLSQNEVTARVEIRDARGFLKRELVDEVPEGRAQFDIAMDGLDPGWYRGTLRVFDGDEQVAQRSQTMAILRSSVERTPLGGGPQFGLRLGAQESATLLRELDQAIALAPDYIVLPIWLPGESASLDAPWARTMEDAVDRLLDIGIEPVFELCGVPKRFVRDERLDSDQLVTLFASEPTVWGGLIGDWMLEFGDGVARWRLTNELASNDERVQRAASQLNTFASEYVAGQVIELTGNASGKPTFGQSAAWSVVQSVDGLGQATALASTIATQGGSEIIAQFEMPSSEHASDVDRAEAITRMLVEVWAAGAQRLELVQPWHMPADSSNQRAIGLGIEGFAFHRVAQALSSRRPEAEVPVSHDVRAVLASGVDGVLVAWRHDASSAADDGIEIDEAHTLVLTDALGERRMLAPTQQPQRITLSQSPLFLTGVDRNVARFKSSVSVLPNRLNAARGLHQVQLHVENPWPETLTVRLRASGPGNWEFLPRSREVAIEPGASVAIPFGLSYPRTQTEGDIMLRFDVFAEAGETHAFSMSVPIRVESATIELETEWRLLRDDDHYLLGLLVTVRARNISSEPLMLESFAYAPGYAPMRKVMPKIAPGGTSSRTFRFSDPDGTLLGREIMLGVQGVERPDRVTNRLHIPVSTGSLVGTDPNAGP